MKIARIIFVAVLLTVFLCAGMATAGTLEDVKAKGFISVGVNEGLFGFSKPDEKGVWRGLDVDTARAISLFAAISKGNNGETRAISGTGSGCASCGASSCATCSH